MFIAVGAIPAWADKSLPSGFSLDTVISGLNQPVAFGFTPSGRVFVAEKAGRVKSFDSIDDGSATTIIDIEHNVNSYADRGLLGLAVDPAFGSGSNYIYVMYTLDIGDTFNDGCADGEGAGCVVNGRLSRYLITGQSAGAEQILLEGFWCQQFPSHSIGDLAFDQNGYLLVSAGDGASYTFADHGQNGNPCEGSDGRWWASGRRGWRPPEPGSARCG